MYFCRNKTHRGSTRQRYENKKSDLLKQLATDSGKTAKQVSEIVVSELLKNKVIEDTPENWGVSVFDAINEDVTEEQTANCYAAISEALGVYLKRVYFIVPDLDLMGDDDCPECGGEMEVTDGEYKQTGGDGYLTPPEYTAIWEEKRVRIADTKRVTNRVINNKRLKKWQK